MDYEAEKPYIKNDVTYELDRRRGCCEKLKAFAASVDPSTKELGQCQEHTRIQDNPFDREALA